MNLGTHMPDGERRKPIDIEVCRSKVQINKTNNHLSSQTIEHKKDNDICQWKSRSWLGTGTKNGSLKSVNEIPNTRHTI
jgi:hypothetical protein